MNKNKAMGKMENKVVSGYLPKLLRNIGIKMYTFFMRRHFHRLYSYIDPRIEFTNPKLISIGHNVSIRPYVWIYAIINPKNTSSPHIEIGDNCVIGRFCHITSSNKVILEGSVLLAEGVLITDSMHGYEDIRIPVIQQPVVSLGPVVIGKGTWIGNGAKIVGKVCIGRNCVIGAGAFVNKDLPDYSIAVGSPARVVKQFDTQKQLWIDLNK